MRDEAKELVHEHAAASVLLEALWRRVDNDRGDDEEDAERDADGEGGDVVHASSGHRRETRAELRDEAGGGVREDIDRGVVIGVNSGITGCVPGL